MTEMPRYRERVKCGTNHDLEARFSPIWIIGWSGDCKGTAESTQDTSKTAGTKNCYGFGYTARALKPKYLGNVPEIQALVTAAQK